jgi:hypothetical protein
VQDNVDELQNYLRRNPPQAPICQPVEVEISVEAEISVAGDAYQMPAFVPYEEPEISLQPAASTSAGTSAAPKKLININGITKLNPEWKKWKTAQNA